MLLMTNEILMQLNFWIFLTEPVFEVQFLFPAATATDELGCFIRKPVDMDDLVKRIKAEIKLAFMYLYQLVVYILERERNLRLLN
jgi:hypothetical protein